MALEVGDVAKKDPPYVPGPTPEQTDPGTGSVGGSTDVDPSPVDTASTDPPVTSTDSTPSIVQDLTIPFIPPGLSKEQTDALRDSNVKILNEEMGFRKSQMDKIDRQDAEFEANMKRLNAAIGYEGDHLK